jgi:hypothetical protein
MGGRALSFAVTICDRKIFHSSKKACRFDALTLICNKNHRIFFDCPDPTKIIEYVLTETLFYKTILK